MQTIVHFMYQKYMGHKKHKDSIFISDLVGRKTHFYLYRLCDCQACCEIQGRTIYIDLYTCSP